MIFCCGAYHESDFVYFLEPNEQYCQRRLEVLNSCPGKNLKCNAFIAELTQIKAKTNEISVVRYKNKKAENFVKKMLKNNKHELFKLVTGTKNNMNWVYGENCERKNKDGMTVAVVQKAVDFNNKKKQSNISIFLFVTPLHNKLENLLCRFFCSFGEAGFKERFA